VFFEVALYNCDIENGEKYKMPTEKEFYSQLLRQLLMLTVTALILDFGQTMRLFALSMALYWTAVFLGICLHRNSRFFFRYGIWMIFAVLMIFKICVH